MDLSDLSRLVYDAPIPSHDKHRKYNGSVSGKAREKRRNESVNRRVSKQVSRDISYMSREFVAWDGEGINETDGSHTYVLLANSDGARILSRNGIRTVDVLDLLLTHAGDRRIHVIYGGNYDINMWLKDLDRESLETLYKSGSVWWRRYRLEWRGGKSFTVFRDGLRFLVYDVLPFFQQSFVKACDEYFGESWPYRDQIILEKQNRGDFDYERIAEISEYNAAELDTLVNLCTELRERLHKVDIRISRWDGPGAIASALYRTYRVKDAISSSPESVARAARHAYAGGRFEIIRKGHTDGGAYQYDIRSAYPSAMRTLPCLSHGRWEHVYRPTRLVPFGVYRIQSHGDLITPTRPQPYWQRNRDGTVYFSGESHGWYWSPEAQLATEATIYEGWEYHQYCDHDPFHFVEPLYNKRAALKKAEDGAHVGLKLGLNSLYGKLAQQVGYDPGPPLRLPPFHCLEWAGYITSHCRAQVYQAAMLAPDDIIAFETDAVFSRVPLPVNVGERLGEWEETKYSTLTYIKSGMYYGTKADGKEVEKTRGINKGSIPRDVAIAELRGAQGKLDATQTRFITLGQALHQNFDIWTHWVTSPRQISTTLWGKRIDIYDSRDNWKLTGDGLEETIPNTPDSDFSHPYDIAWINGDTKYMDERLMDAHTDYEGIME